MLAKTPANKRMQAMSKKPTKHFTDTELNDALQLVVNTFDSYGLGPRIDSLREQGEWD